MKIPHQLKKVKYRPSAELMTSFAGLKTVWDLAIRLGIVKNLERVTIKKRHRGIEVADFVMSLVGNFLVGGEHLSDLRVLRSEIATRGQLYDLAVPAPTTAGEGLRKFSLGNIKQLERVTTEALLEVEKRQPDDAPITLDIDSSIYEVHGQCKEGAKFGYSGVRGYHPLLGFWSERRVLVGVRQRSGNARSAAKASSFVSQCLSRLPQGRRVVLRLDAGFYDKKFVGYLLDRELEFTLSAYVTEGLVKAVEALPEQQWKPYPWQDQCEWAELKYQPTDWPKELRLLVKRCAPNSKQQKLGQKYCYRPVITNRTGAGSSLLKFHFNRGGAENYIEEFKNGVGTRIAPSRKFSANYAWLVVGQLAYNLTQWFKQLLLPITEASSQLKNLRLAYFCVAARIIHTGRRTIYALARASNDCLRFEKMAERIAAL